MSGVVGRPARICAMCLSLCAGIVAELPSSEHPERDARLAAVRDAWRQAREEAAGAAPGWAARARALLETTEMSALEAVRVVANLGGHEPPRVVQRLSCSFCGRYQPEVVKLIAGSDGHVCDRCVVELAALI